MINERTKYRIANKWDDQTKKYSQDQFDFEDKGSVGVGRINWSTKKKDKSGDKFISSSLKFVCFGETKDLIANNLGAKFEIDANLCNESFTNQEGKKIAYWQLTIFNARIAEPAINSHNQAKGNGYQPQDDFSDETSF